MIRCYCSRLFKNHWPNWRKCSQNFIFLFAIFLEILYHSNGGIHLARTFSVLLSVYLEGLGAFLVSLIKSLLKQPEILLRLFRDHYLCMLLVNLQYPPFHCSNDVFLEKRIMLNKKYNILFQLFVLFTVSKVGWTSSLLYLASLNLFALFCDFGSFEMNNETQIL